MDRDVFARAIDLGLASVPAQLSVPIIAVGIWLTRGSRHEPRALPSL